MESSKGAKKKKGKKKKEKGFEEGVDDVDEKVIEADFEEKEE